MRKSPTALRALLLATLSLTAVAATPHTARAALTLTDAAIADGFLLTTFASGFPSVSGVGPIGVGFFAGGGVVVTSYADSSVVTFTSDTDGQTVAGTGTVRTGYSIPTGAVTIGGVVYVANQTGSIVQLNSDGTINHTVSDGLGSPTGLAVNPGTGHILVSDNSSTILDIDPANGAVTTFKSGVAVDGLTMSLDGTTLFAESGEHILGYNLSTGTQTFDSGLVPTADGAAAAGGLLAGNLFVNTNDGNVYEINETTLLQTLIATGGSRGDLVTVDPNGSLLLSQTDSVMRLTLPTGSTFSDVPEPSSMALLAFGIAAIRTLRRRRR